MEKSRLSLTTSERNMDERYGTPIYPACTLGKELRLFTFPWSVWSSWKVRDVWRSCLTNRLLQWSEQWRNQPIKDRGTLCRRCEHTSWTLCTHCLSMITVCRWERQNLTRILTWKSLVFESALIWPILKEGCWIRPTWSAVTNVWFVMCDCTLGLCLILYSHYRLSLTKGPGTERWEANASSVGWMWTNGQY